MKNLMIILLGGALLGISLAYAMDRQFIIDYANAYGYDAEMIHTAESEEECDEDTFFDKDYGLCVPIVLTSSDTEVGM